MYSFDLGPRDYVREELSTLWWLYICKAVSLILLGITIIVWPELLAILAASFLIAAGSVLLLLAWRVRRIKRRYKTYRIAAI